MHCLTLLISLYVICCNDNKQLFYSMVIFTILWQMTTYLLNLIVYFNTSTVHLLQINSFPIFFNFCLQETMRRSGAPSQISGNAMKKPRFLPPASSTFCPLAEPKPLSPKPGLCNTLQKVQYSLYFFFYIIY